MTDTDPPNLRENSLKKKAVQPRIGTHFSLPRLKKVKRDLLTELPLDSQECQQEILSVMKKSFHSPLSLRTHEFRNVQAINNPELTSKYLEKKREWKSMGYSDSLLTDTYAFLSVEDSSQVEKICRKGVCCGNQAFSGLGVSHMAVHLSKHADILTPTRQNQGDKICILVKLLKGKVKTVVCKNVGVQLEPTPNYDCHIAKPNVEQTASMPYHLLFYSMQLYVYEYGDLGVEDYPKQILPFAAIHYTLKEPSPAHHKQISNVLRGAVFKPEQQSVLPPSPQSTAVVGPKNEVWRGKLHVSLIDGGKLNIEVSLFSHFVPLTVNLLSPLKIYKLYPESSAQTTYFAGLTDIADKAEVPWREHYFRSFVMRPRRNNEEHFRALIRHISDRREMPCVGLPNDIYLFLMAKCLLSSQLGLVQREDNSPVLYCVLMSKFSTIKAEKKKMKQRMGNGYLRHYGKASSWAELFEDSDKDEDGEDEAQKPFGKPLDGVQLDSLFQQQRLVQNKLASLSLSDMAANIAPCDCPLNGESASRQRDRRNTDIVHMTSGIEASIRNHQQRSKPKEAAISHFPSRSRTKPRQNTSQHSRTPSSFSPHRSSDSDSDSDYDTKENGKRSKGSSHYSVLMNSYKTVEEELSEEELTAEQMDDIIFMRKPSTVAKAKSTLLSKAESKLKSTSNSSDKNLSLLSKPRIIPVEPMVEEIASPPREWINDSTQPAAPKIIPTDPVSSPPPRIHQSSPTPPLPCNPVTQPNPPKPKSILKNKRSLDSPAPFQVCSILKNDDGRSQSPVSPSPSSTAISRVTGSSTICQQTVHAVKTLESTSVSSVSASAISSKNVIAQPHNSNTDNNAYTTPVTNTGSTQYPTQSYPSGRHNHHIDPRPHFPPMMPPPPIPMDQDMGDIDMRVPPPYHHFQQTSSLHIPSNPLPPLSTTSTSSKSRHSQHQPLSPNLSLGSWLGPQDLLQHSKPVNPHVTHLHSHHSPTTNLSKTTFLSSSPSPLSPKSSSSPFKPCTPVEELFDIDASMTSPPSMSPPSPSPLDSPMSPPKSPSMELESPASPPMSSCVNDLRFSPIAIPTVRVQKSVLSPTSPFPIGHDSASPSKIDLVGKNESPSSAKQVENADDMKDFLNSATGFDSEIDSPNEDDSFGEEGYLPKEVENADDMKSILNAGMGEFESESPYEDER